MATHRPQHYRAYLVRFWQETAGQPWRAVVVDAHTQEQRAFATLDAMLHFLAQQATPTAGPAHSSEEKTHE